MSSKENNEKVKELKKAGLSNEQAARFSNVGEESNGMSKPDYEKWSREELYRKAEEFNIQGIASMDKNLLIETLRHHQR